MTKQTIVIKRAKFMHFSGAVKEAGKSERKEYYTCFDEESNKTHQIMLEHSQDGLLISDDCTFQSLPSKANLNKGRQPLCSHMIAVLLRKVSEIKLK